MQVLAHERPDESEAPTSAFQQRAFLFIADFGEQPDVCPGPCVVEQSRVVFVVDALCAIGCLRACTLNGTWRPTLGGTPRSRSGRRRRAWVLFAEANVRRVKDSNGLAGSVLGLPSWWLSSVQGD